MGKSCYLRGGSLLGAGGIASLESQLWTGAASRRPAHRPVPAGHKPARRDPARRVLAGNAGIGAETLVEGAILAPDLRGLALPCRRHRFLSGGPDRFPVLAPDRRPSSALRARGTRDP